MVRREDREIIYGRIRESLEVMLRVVRWPDVYVRKPILATCGMEGGLTGSGHTGSGQERLLCSFRRGKVVTPAPGSMKWGWWGAMQSRDIWEVKLPGLTHLFTRPPDIDKGTTPLSAPGFKGLPSIPLFKANCSTNSRMSILNHRIALHTSPSGHSLLLHSWASDRRAASPQATQWPVIYGLVWNYF